jgi:PDZ domain-containing secreted protein
LEPESLEPGERIVEELREELEKLSLSGAAISQVVPGSPAEDAGLRAGDIVVAVDGTQIDRQHDLAGLIGQYEPGDRITLQIQRPDGDEMELRVRLGEHPDREGAPFLGVTYALAIESEFELERLLPGEMPEGRLPLEDLPFHLLPEGRITGVIVIEVAEGSPAEKAGLEANDIITSVDGQEVEDPEQLADIIGRHEPGDRVELGIQRIGADEPQRVTVTLDAHPDDKEKGYLGVTISGAVRIHGSGTDDDSRFDFRFWGPGGPGLNFDWNRDGLLDEGWPFDRDLRPFRGGNGD